MSADDWNQHWSDYASSAELNPAQQYRFENITQIIRSMKLYPTQIIDLGCGTGALLEVLQNEFPTAKLLGIEPSKTGFTLASRRLPDVQILKQDIISESVDNRNVCLGTIVVCSEVLEHLDDPLLLLRAIKKQFGMADAMLIISVPGGVRSAYDVHIGHRRHFSRETLESVMSQGGLSEIKIWRGGFPFFNIYKLITVMLGSRLISRPSPVSPKSTWFRNLSRLLTVCMRRSFRDSPFGWQLFATASCSETLELESNG